MNLLYRPQIRNSAIITLIFVLSFLLRFYRLGAHDFWFDEIISVSYSAVPWHNWNAPLYWILLHFWVKIFGISEFSLRFPSMLYSFLTTVIVFLLGNELFDKKTAILATLIICLSPFHLWYAQEARDYSMVLFFSVLSSYFFLLAIKENSLKGWILFAIASLFGAYTNYFYIFLIIAQFLYILYATRLRAGKAYLSFLFVAGAFSFYVPRFISKFLFVSKGFWVTKPDWQSLNIVLQNYMLGYNGTGFLYAVSSLLALTAFIILFFTAHKEKEMRRNISFCVFLLFIPIGLAFLFSKLFFSIYLNRGMLLFSPYFYLLISYAVMRLRKGVMVVGSCILILILSCGAGLYFQDYMYPPLEYHLGTYIKKPVRHILYFLNSHVKKGDLVGLTNESVMPGIDFYAKGKFSLYYLFSPKILDSSWQRQVGETQYYVPMHKITGLEFKRIWVIFSDWERSGGLDENSTAVKQWLDINLRSISNQVLDGLQVYCYERKNT